jgi:hypothetical protein
MPTTLSCHVQNYSAVRGRTLHVAVQKNTARVPLSRGGIPQSVQALLCKIQGVIIAFLYRVRVPPWFVFSK